MNNAKPLTKVVTDGLLSAPWSRSSLSLGRPYNVKYRFGSLLHATRPSRRTIVTSTANNDQLYDEHQASVERGKPALRSKSKARDARLKYTLVTSEDLASGFDYDTKVQAAKPEITHRSTSDIYGILRVAAGSGTVASIYRVQAGVNYLLGERGEEPNLKLYSALILANSRTDGSVRNVQRLLKEMEAEGLALDVGACHDILKVLSVHPDYILRTEVLQHMHSKWFALTPSGHHDIVAGLLREGQVEMALERMEVMRSEGMRIFGWLYDLAIYIFGEREELDEVMDLIKLRVASGDMNISGTLWHYLLDISSRAMHYELTSYVWKSRVQVNYLNPSTGMCANIMNVAARNADVELAQDVFAFLGRRNTVFEPQHYEMMLEAYLNTDQPQNSLYVLSAMQQAKVIPNEGTTRYLYRYLQGDRERPAELYRELQEIQKNGGAVPIAAMNVLIEAACYHRNLDFVIELYKAIPEICDSNANLATFNNVFRACRASGNRKDLALMLASEMVSLKILPSALTYDRMLLICLGQDDYEDGVRYYQEMRAKGMEPRFRSMIEFVRTLTKWGDQRVYEVLDDMETMDLQVRMVELRRWVDQHFGRETEVSEIIQNSSVRGYTNPDDSTNRLKDSV